MLDNVQTVKNDFVSKLFQLITGNQIKLFVTGSQEN